ncbi:MAG TPA: AAA family ATPase [Vicinamibacteria bacterium]|nr:AAA family ATPase [Vicinamibacteria bacterium]
MTGGERLQETPAATAERAGAPAFVRRVRIRNYKSLGKCDVELHALTLLVGRNGSGKSNFLDALRFVTDGLQTSLDHAIKSRGGIDAVRRRSTGHPRNFAIDLDITLDDWNLATYGFEISARSRGKFAVKREQLRIGRSDGRSIASYVVADGEVVQSSAPNPPPAFRDRLYLVTASGLPEFRSAYDALLAMGFYNLNPDAMKELQSPDAGELLHRDGANIASVVSRLRTDQPETMNRIIAYLTSVVPGIVDVERIALGPRETLEFRQEVKGASHPWRFYAVSVSDGTLRALGILAAVMQFVGHERPVRFVGVEEPETALHPAAAGALMDALSEAAQHTQIVVTSHSGVLLDEIDIDEHGLLAVISEQGVTKLGAIDEASVQSIREHLYTAGELQRMDQLGPDVEDLKRQEQLQLFEEDEEP